MTPAEQDLYQRATELSKIEYRNTTQQEELFRLVVELSNIVYRNTLELIRKGDYVIYFDSDMNVVGTDYILKNNG